MATDRLCLFLSLSVSVSVCLSVSLCVSPSPPVPRHTHECRHPDTGRRVARRLAGSCHGPPRKHLDTWARLVVSGRAGVAGSSYPCAVLAASSPAPRPECVPGCCPAGTPGSLGHLPASPRPDRLGSQAPLNRVRPVHVSLRPRPPTLARPLRSQRPPRLLVMSFLRCGQGLGV